MWLTVALALAAGSSPQGRIAVLDISIRSGLPADLGQTLSEAVVAQVRKRRPRASVVSADEIRAMIQAQGQRQKVGCSQDVACLTEIGGALGAESLVVGSLGKLGSVYVYGLKLLDVSRGKVLASGSVSLPSHDDAALLDSTVTLVNQLFPEEAVVALTPVPVAAIEPPTPVEVATVAPPPGHSRLPAVLLGVGGLVCAGVAVYGLTRVLQYDSDVNAINAGTGGRFTQSTYQSDKSSAQLWQPLGIGLAVLAAAGLSGAVIAW